VFVVIRRVHRTACAVHAARHPRFGRRLPAGADGNVADEQGQESHDSRTPPNQRDHSLRMVDVRSDVKWHERVWLFMLSCLCQNGGK
jgi:hypothetical protein